MGGPLVWMRCLEMADRAVGICAKSRHNSISNGKVSYTSLEGGKQSVASPLEVASPGPQFIPRQSLSCMHYKWLDTGGVGGRLVSEA